MKIKITKKVTDKEEKTVLEPGTVITRNKDRGQAFIDAGVGEEVEEKKKKSSKKK